MTPPFQMFTERARRRAPLLAAASAALVLIGAVTVAYAEHSQYEERVRAQVLSDVSDVRASLEAALANRLVLPDALAALAIAHQGDVIGEFEEFAQGLAESHRSYLGVTGEDPAVRSLQLAPDAVVTHVYPLEGNEAAVGHDLLADPVRGPAVQRAIDERRFVLAGPFELLQGGMGLVGRAPIYLGAEEAFWGFATVVLNFDDIRAEAGLAEMTRNGLSYSLRGRDGLGAEGDVFAGDELVFDHDPVVLDVLVPNGTWQIAAHPVAGWPVFPLRGASLAIIATGVLLAGLVATTVLRWEKERQAVLRVSDNLTRLVDSTTSPIVAVDAAGWITEWNRAMVELSGVSSEAARTNHFEHLSSTVFDAGPASEDLLAAIESVRSGARDSIEITLTAGAPRRIVSFLVTPRLDPGGSRGVVLVGHDMTVRLDAERMQAENVALARSARLKDEFLAGMSHELRTPLNAIIGLSSVLSRQTFGELSDKQSEYVDLISSSGEHLLGLINDVLDLAKLDADRVELEIRPCDLGSVVRDSLDMVRHQADQRGVAISEPLLKGDLGVTADRRRVQQVIVNLASNAVKFTERGGRMGVDVERAGEEIAITVWDTGIGIDPDKRHLLFRPFQQVDGSLSREQEGSGLGLAIAAKLVELHGGTISVDSRPGHGSWFTVTLPVAGPNEAGESTTVEAVATGA